MVAMGLIHDCHRRLVDIKKFLMLMLIMPLNIISLSHMPMPIPKSLPALIQIPPDPLLLVAPNPDTLRPDLIGLRVMAHSLPVLETVRPLILACWSYAALKWNQHWGMIGGVEGQG